LRACGLTGLAGGAAASAPAFGALARWKLPEILNRHVAIKGSACEPTSDRPVA
jgi:hypothetical protein